MAEPELDCHDCLVPGAAEISAQEAVTLLAHASSDHYELVGRLSGGETGAHEVIGPAGQQLIMKWESKPRSQILRSEAVVFSARLRVEAGWPVPIQTVVDTQGVRLVLQEFMPGGPITELGHRIVNELLDLHGRRLGLARPGDPMHWPSALIKTLTTGGDSYCLHSSLRDYDDRTRSLIARIEAFGNSIAEADLDGHDIVHWDLHPGNLLMDEGSLSAIVDTDFAVVGDARFDLVMLALTSLTVPCEAGARSQLFAAAFDELDELRAQTYLAHLFIRLLDWPIRKDRPDEVAFWLSRSDEMLHL
jgi:thiamine kinase-like enzyme